jgi:hypothetical protein
MDDVIATAIKTVVRRVGSARFSTEERQLRLEDFSFKFVRPEKYDELTHDIIVRIRLHAFPSRLVGTDDRCKEIAEGISNELLFGSDIQVITIGVELMVCEVGWGSAGIVTVGT